jgi:hypothetical protein
MYCPARNPHNYYYKSYSKNKALKTPIKIYTKTAFKQLKRTLIININ